MKKNKLDFLKAIGNIINKDMLYMQKESDARAQLTKLLPVYFPYNHYTIKYYDLEKIINQIMFSGAKKILELGSGLSTLCMAALKGFDENIHIHSLEHNNNWKDLMSKLITMNNLQNVRLEYVTLREFTDAGFKGRFFDLENVQLELYDAIIIDGPPANKKELIHSRYPAVHLLKNNLKQNGFFYFDDVHRKGESDCLIHWKHTISFQPTLKHQFGNGQIFVLK